MNMDLKSVSACTHSLLQLEGSNFVDENNKVYLQNNTDGEIMQIEYTPELREIYGYHEQQINSINNNEQIERTWTKNAILCLINLYKKRINEFKSNSIKNESVYKIIAKEMQLEGHARTPIQCRDKFKYLKMKYMRKVDNMSTESTGAARINFEFFKEMHEIYAEKPNVKPVAIASSSGTSIDGVSSGKELLANGDEVRPSTSTAEFHKKESKESATERRHQERLNMQQQALGTFEKYMKLLLEKL